MLTPTKSFKVKTIKRSVVLSCLLFSFKMSFATTLVGSQPLNTVFPDPVFANEIASRLGVATTDNITAAQLTAIGNLTMDYTGITPKIASVEGLQYLTALGHFQLTSSEITTLPSNVESRNDFIINDSKMTVMPKDFMETTLASRITFTNNSVLSAFETGTNFSAFTFESLVISDNNFTSIPGELFTQSRIGLLTVSRNPLTSLPDAIGAAVGMSRLTAYDCGLTVLPATTGSGSITDLRVSDNALTALPANIGTTSTIIRVIADNNQISALPETFGRVFNSIFIGGNAFTEATPAGFATTFRFSAPSQTATLAPASFSEGSVIGASDILPANLLQEITTKGTLLAGSTITVDGVVTPITDGSEITAALFPAVGPYTVTVNVGPDPASPNNASSYPDSVYTRIVTIAAVVNQLPTITAYDKILDAGALYDPLADVSASDPEDGDLTAQIVILDNDGYLGLGSDAAGTYVLTYQVTDSQGAVSTAIRKIAVNGASTVPPICYVPKPIPTFSAAGLLALLLVIPVGAHLAMKKIA